eukprot:TRINITY_DN52692_c0_g1_i1.p1 TRINITY_DN52692_c0_g1~~TRINITY_DN52692_c0_g1_i1.p1  ORF type:complete len:279 (+),score=18.75 TRINITY_DN52692_c0_g1_i1:59-895(+)
MSLPDSKRRRTAGSPSSAQEEQPSCPTTEIEKQETTGDVNNVQLQIEEEPSKPIKHCVGCGATANTSCGECDKALCEHCCVQRCGAEDCRLCEKCWDDTTLSWCDKCDKTFCGHCTEDWLQCAGDDHRGPIHEGCVDVMYCESCKCTTFCESCWDHNSIEYVFECTHCATRSCVDCSCYCGNVEGFPDHCLWCCVQVAPMWQPEVHHFVSVKAQVMVKMFYLTMTKTDLLFSDLIREVASWICPFQPGKIEYGAWNLQEYHHRRVSEFNEGKKKTPLF